MKISQVTIDRIKSVMDIEEVVGDYVALKRSGQNLWACCPFHEEKSPSFSVAPNKGFYKCFGCGKAGDAITFVMDMDGLSYVEALRHLAAKYNIEVEEIQSSNLEQEEYNERESLFIVLNYAKDHFVNNLWESEEGRSIGVSYFKERGFDESIIKKFDLGYSINAWDNLLSKAQKDGHKIDLLESAGLIVPKEKEGQVVSHYDRFRGRVIFPIHNVSGKVIAFGARVLSKDKSIKEPKYINSPETDIYHKGSILYGISQARNSIRQHDNCFLVEGYTDVISLHMSGVDNVVASSGTSLTEDQIKLIKRYTENITFLFDGDQAGIKASLRGIDMVLEGDLNVKVVLFPNGEDPDSYSQKVGSAAFQQFIKDNTQDFITFKTSLYAEESAKDPIKRANSIIEIIGSIAKIPNPLKRNIYIQECSRLLDVDESVLLTELNKLLIKHQREVKQDVKQQEKLMKSLLDEGITTDVRIEKDNTYLPERELIRMLICFGHLPIEEKGFLFQYLLEELEGLEFSEPIHKKIVEEYKNHIQDGIVPQGDFFTSHSNRQIQELSINLTISKYELSKNWSDKFQIYIPSEEDILDKVVYTNILRYKFRKVQNMIKEHMQQLKDMSGEAFEEEIKLIHELKRTEMEISKALGIVVGRSN
jgi:DNA primase